MSDNRKLLVSDDLSFSKKSSQPSSSILPPFQIGHSQKQFGYIAECPGSNGCKACHGLVKMSLGFDLQDGTKYSLDCCCKCHYQSNGSRRNKHNFTQIKELLEAANIAELKSKGDFK